MTGHALAVGENGRNINMETKRGRHSERETPRVRQKDGGGDKNKGGKMRRRPLSVELYNRSSAEL